MDNDKFQADRYSALAEVWTNHNTTLWQWPALILAAVFVAVPLLVEKITIEEVVKVNLWGINVRVKYGAGIPLLLFAFGTMVMLYPMARTRKVMKRVERELNEIEKLNSVKRYFGVVNHPSGMSGPLLLWVFLAVLAIVLMILGLFFLIGLNYHGYMLAAIAFTFCLLWYAYCCVNWD
jgi:hypothetical protein